MLLLQSSFLSNASLGSHWRIDLKDSADMLERCRQSLIRIAFPYLETKEEPKKEESYDAYFDELDEIIESEKAEKAEEAEKSAKTGSGEASESLPGKVEMV